ncbi:hypothetical protein EV702DRAFT_1193545 [Suillus placidus]|uniref:Secreted protein n=1 Tax=Suillus placidus TaxID=48579 RepID=A0A9P7A3E0_9AGAM|nr:hypothetical protein EV702DRAFT_1193545 [Suillus placidus]
MHRALLVDDSLLLLFLSPTLASLAFDVLSGAPVDEVEQLITALPEGLRLLPLFPTIHYTIRHYLAKVERTRPDRSRCVSYGAIKGLCGVLQRCISLLLCIATPQLSSFSITYWKRGFEEEVREFVLSLLISCQTFASLEEIAARSTCLHLASLLPSRPLFRLGKLAIVDVGYHPDDAFIKDTSCLAGHL